LPPSLSCDGRDQNTDQLKDGLADAGKPVMQLAIEFPEQRPLYIRHIAYGIEILTDLMSFLRVPAAA